MLIKLTTAPHCKRHKTVYFFQVYVVNNEKRKVFNLFKENIKFQILSPVLKVKRKKGSFYYLINGNNFHLNLKYFL